MKSTHKKLFVVAAGSGGHILPALVLAKAWKEAAEHGKVIFVGSGQTLDAKIVASHPFIDKTLALTVDKFSFKKFWLYPKILFQVIKAFIKSIKYVLRYKPEKIISTGGLIALPICLAARMARIPIDLYELNVEPGKAVKVLMPFASTIFITFLQSKAHCKFLGIDFSNKCEYVPYPIRFTEADKKIDKQEIINRINTQLDNKDYLFSEKRKTLFIVGGSQGSVFLNKLIKRFIEEQSALTNSLQIIHQAGSNQSVNWDEFYAQANIPAYAFSYDDRIKDYYLLADVIVCRAGAGTLFEIEFFEKRCLVIPLVAQTTSHQIDNAEAMAERHPTLFHVLTQDDVAQNFDLFSDAILRLLVRG